MLPSWFQLLTESEVFNAIFFVLPAFFSNTTPMLFGGGIPMDFRKNWFDGRRILGNNKTWRGFAAGFIGGFLFGIFISWWFTTIVFKNMADPPFIVPLTNGFLQGFGAVTGDAVGSFIKRRLDIPPGGSLIIMDQIGFIIFGLAFARMDTAFPWTYWVILIPLSLVLHFAANAVGYTMGWKDVWW